MKPSTISRIIGALWIGAAIVILVQSFVGSLSAVDANQYWCIGCLALGVGGARLQLANLEDANP